MHPRTQYLADSQDPAQQPLLQDTSRAAPESPVLQSAAESRPTYGKGSKSDTPSAPPLSKGSTAAGSSNAEPPNTSDYCLPSGYQAQYAGTQPLASTAASKRLPYS